MHYKHCEFGCDHYDVQCSWRAKYVFVWISSSIRDNCLARYTFYINACAVNTASLDAVGQ